MTETNRSYKYVRESSDLNIQLWLINVLQKFLRDFVTWFLKGLNYQDSYVQSSFLGVELSLFLNNWEHEEKQPLASQD